MRILTLALVLCLAATPALAFFGLFDSAERVKAADGMVTLDASRLSPGSAKHYEYREDTTTIRFFLVRDNQGTIRAALDACEVCWREGKGYTLKSEAMHCTNCGQRFPLNRIGLIRGGCNPHPVEFAIDGDTVRITTAELMAGARYFAGENS